MVKPLIDCDVLLYEIGFSSQSKELVAGEGYEIQPRSWEFCQQLFDNKIKEICFHVDATESPLLFLTNTKYINKLLNKKRKYEKEPVKEYVHNFRDEVASIRKYKDGRNPDKPFHYKNLINYVLNNYDYYVDENGLEADDAMCINQYGWVRNNIFNTVICSRDKDVRQCPGLHYSWECGKQLAIGPIMVDELGSLSNVNENKFNSKTGKPMPLKVFGTGTKFFYYQMLTGDTVDNIVGVMGRGPTFAYNLLKDATTEWELYQLVAEVYVKTWGDEWEEKMREMADLLWMIREIDEEGKAVKWKKPEMDMTQYL